MCFLWGGNKTPGIIRRSLCPETRRVRRPHLSGCDPQRQNITFKGSSDFDAVDRGFHYKWSNSRLSLEEAALLRRRNLESSRTTYLSPLATSVTVTDCVATFCVGPCFLNRVPVPNPGLASWSSKFWVGVFNFPWRQPRYFGGFNFDWWSCLWGLVHRRI